MIKLKRAYDRPSNADGVRVLVDRLWPRGVKKDALELSFWIKDLAPSTELRKWFDHDPAKWDEFRARYRKELERPEARRLLAELAQSGKRGRLTLVYGARDEKHNQAVVLKEALEKLG
ncbi:MAG TPA: DUF488 domain-containing protein [Candidatus Binataceae bacterium]|nr:DUF488 domain-containing protein [Candidatus Binataceae bacterium]